MNEAQNGAAMQTASAAEASAPPGRKPMWRRWPVIVLGTVIFGLALYYGLGYLAETFTHESTDDAFLDAHIVAIAPKVAGRVGRVLVEDNQLVRAGEPLVEIEPEDLRVALGQKEATLKAAQANVELVKATVDLFRSQIASAQATAKQTAAEAAAAQATADRAQSDLKRAQDLIQNHTISPQEFDNVKATADAATANLRAAQEKAASEESKVGQAEAQLTAGIKGYQRAEAQTHESDLDVDAARLNLSYTRIEAPEDGHVTRKAVAVGDYVQAGQELMALVPARLYVTANFKETQLRSVRTNQPVRITVDSVSAHTFKGHVDSIQAGSGARFSLLPPENAVGNYVKVVQRVPVKIVFDEPLASPHVLGPGMSVVPSIHVTAYEMPEVAIIGGTLVVALLIGGFWWRAASKSAAARRQTP
jgi:membrane fusion protein (multidrug efflux system)